MRELSANLEASVAQTVTTPAFLIQIDFSTVLRLSSRGDQSWDGNLWTGGRLGKIQASSDGGQVEIMNSDLAAGALVLNEGISDRPISIWQFYGDNPDLADAVQIFSGVGDSAEIAHDRIRIKLTAGNRRTLYSPRRFINSVSGFNNLLPAGTRITWGGETFTLER